MKKVLFISSTGGHLSEMMMLKDLFSKYDYHIITEKTKSNMKLKDKCFKSLYYYIKIRPDFIVTTGAHTAGPMCCLGKIFGSKIIYIETFANMKSKTATGKLVYKFADMFVVQWKSMLKIYPKATYGGWIY